MRVESLVAVAVMCVVGVAGLTAQGRGTALKAAPAAQKTAVERTTRAVAADDKPDADGLTGLHRAVYADDLVRAEALIKGGADVNATTLYGVPPISLAALNGNAKMVALLLKASADPNATMGDGETVLMTAARTGDAEVVKMLLSAGAFVDASEALYEQTALMWAAARNNVAAAQALVDAGASLDMRSKFGSRDPNEGCSGPCSVIPGALTAVALAAREGSLGALRVLAEGGADLNIGDMNGNVPLVYALINGHYDAAALLLESGADATAVDRTGRGPLFVAVDMHSLEFRFNRPEPKHVDKHTSFDLIRMLLDYGAVVDQPLKSRIDAPKFFAGGNRNLTAGATPFLKAATTSDVEVMKLLLERGADPRATNSTKTNALLMTSGLNWVIGQWTRGTQERTIEAIKLLLDNYGFDINATDNNGDTALHGAAHRTEDQDANDIIKYLVDRGANLYAKNKRGRTPMDEAMGSDPTVNLGGDVRAANFRTRALLVELMKTHPDPSKSMTSSQ